MKRSCFLNLPLIAAKCAFVILSRLTRALCRLHNSVSLFNLRLECVSLVMSSYIETARDPEI